MPDYKAALQFLLDNLQVLTHQKVIWLEEYGGYDMVEYARRDMYRDIGAELNKIATEIREESLDKQTATIRIRVYGVSEDVLKKTKAMVTIDYPQDKS